jgi:LysM domain
MRIVIIILSIFVTIQSQALSLKDNPPNEYVVKTGDTLWGIASRYLDSPWEWKDLWHANPKIKNPNRLYPGAILHLRFFKNKPYLTVTRNGTIKLSPHARPAPLENAIPPIPLNDIKPFLNGSEVFDEDILGHAPYIAAYFGEHLVGGQGDIVYVKDLDKVEFNPMTGHAINPENYISYAVFRPDGVYEEPVSKEFLGFKAKLIGFAQMIKRGDPATMILSDINEGVHLKDRVLPDDKPTFSPYFEPQTPTMQIDGHIIDIFGGITQVARGQVVVIDKGKNFDLVPGVVLALYQRGRIIEDPINRQKEIKLPQERIGEVMLFKIFSRTSYGLIVRSIRSVKKLDTVTSP